MDVIQLDVKGVGVVLARQLERQDGRVAGGGDGVVALDVGGEGVGVVEGVKVVKVDTVEADEDVALVEGELGSLGDVVPVAEGVGGAGDETGDGLSQAGLLVALGPADKGGAVTRVAGSVGLVVDDARLALEGPEGEGLVTLEATSVDNVGCVASRSIAGGGGLGSGGGRLSSGGRTGLC